MSSDPICSSAGCWKSPYTKKVDTKIIQYRDPDADGLDADIITTQKNQARAEAELLWVKWVGTNSNEWV